MCLYLSNFLEFVSSYLSLAQDNFDESLSISMGRNQDGVDVMRKGRGNVYLQFKLLFLLFLSVSLILRVDKIFIIDDLVHLLIQSLHFDELLVGCLCYE